MARADKVGAARPFAAVAALLVLLSAVIDAVVVPAHLEEYWLFGVLFAVSAGLQATWTGLIFAERHAARPGRRRLRKRRARCGVGALPGGFVDRA